ncbi:hsp90 co-chaperone Cdc37 [Sarcoptes scabiei]|nr:hsp90 co-chaperone Cdc37 [Sarcoptes scabiei]
MDSSPSIVSNRSSFTNIERSLNVRRHQAIIYQALTKPSGFWPIVYHSFITSILLIDLIFLAVSTVKSQAYWASYALKLFDAIVLIVLSIELVLRIWTAPYHPKYRGVKGTLRFLLEPSCLLDLIAIIVTALLLNKQWIFKNIVPNQSLDCLRIFQIIKLIRVDMPSKRWRLVMSVIWMQQQQLLIIFHVCLIVMIVITFTIYFVEQNDSDTDFTSIPITMWWAIVSLLTVGYGDMLPKTIFGKILAAILLMFSISLYAVPSGIIGTGIALKVQEQKRHKKRQIRRRLPAALLIQWTWRYFVVTRFKPVIDQTQNKQKLSLPSTSSSSSMIQFPITFQAINQKLSEHNRNPSRNSFSSPLGSISIPLKSIVVDNRSNDSTEQNSEFEIELPNLNPKELMLIRLFCLLQFQLARLRFQASNPFGDINDLIDRHQMVHEDLIKRFQNISNLLMAIQNRLGPN